MNVRNGTAHGPSFLRWAGSKRKSLVKLRAAYSADRHYVEPFAGSAALFFSLQPSEATLGDLNGALINTMKWVRQEPESVHKQLACLSRSRESYYRYRDEFNRSSADTIEAAILFLYLNRNCFNGLWRTNKEGKFNVPYGGTEMGSNPPLDLLRKCAMALRKASLRHQDFRKTIEGTDKNTFIYADPPYFTATERTFIEYGAKSFGEGDLRDLVHGLEAAAARGAKVALTYNAAVPLASIPASWHVEAITVTRNVGGFSGSRKVQTELLYTN